MHKEQPIRRAQDREAVVTERYTMYQLGQDMQVVFFQMEQMMTAMDDLRVKVAALQAAVDADQASDAGVEASLRAEIDRLTGELAGGASAEQVAEIVTDLEAIIVDVSGPNAPIEPAPEFPDPNV